MTGRPHAPTVQRHSWARPDSGGWLRIVDVHPVPAAAVEIETASNEPKRAVDSPTQRATEPFRLENLEAYLPLVLAALEAGRTIGEIAADLQIPPWAVDLVAHANIVSALKGAAARLRSEILGLRADLAVWP